LARINKQLKQKRNQKQRNKKRPRRMIGLLKSSLL